MVSERSGPDDLMRPPLMAHFVGDDVVDHVNVVGMIEIGYEADRFGVGHGAGEGLGKTGNAREFNDAGFLVIVGAEVGGVVGEGFLQGIHHAGNVPGVIGIVVDLELDAVPILALDSVARGHEGEEIQR